MQERYVCTRKGHSDRMLFVRVPTVLPRHHSVHGLNLSICKNYGTCRERCSCSSLTTPSLTLTHRLVPAARRMAGQTPSPDLPVLRFGMWTAGNLSLANTLSMLSFDCSRRAGGSQASKPNSTRAAGAGGSSGTLLKLYTDDAPGLRVCVSFS